MKIQIKTIACLLLLAVGAKAEDAAPLKPEEKPPFEVRIQAGRTHFLAGEPVSLSVTVSNNTDKTKIFLYVNPAMEWKVKIPGGGDSQKTAYANHFDDWMTANLRIVRPHDLITFKVLLSRLLDMTRSGAYKVTGLQWPAAENPPGLTGTAIESNMLELTIEAQDVNEAKAK